MPPVNTSSSPIDIKAYQAQLQRVGLYMGTVDGIWGPMTRRADEAFRAQFADPTPAAEAPDINAAIVACATHFLNLTETVSNAVWDDVLTAGQDARGAELRQSLLDTGWQLGWAYCAAFAEVCWRAGYRDRAELPLICKSMTPSVMGTFDNFDHLKRITQKPVPGALMLMQHGNTYQGHAGIVVSVSGSTFSTIEGNTSQAGGTVEQQRNGDGVYRKTHTLDFTKFDSRLWLKGFVNPFTV